MAKKNKYINLRAKGSNEMNYITKIIYTQKKKTQNKITQNKIKQKIKKTPRKTQKNTKTKTK